VQAIVGVFWLADALVYRLHPSGTAEALGIFYIFYIVFAVFEALILAGALPKRALAAVLAAAVPRFLVYLRGIAAGGHPRPGDRAGRPARSSSGGHCGHPSGPWEGQRSLPR
jgi:hypothetical protein